MGVREVLIDKFMPSGVDSFQWITGKPTRSDVFEYVAIIQDQLTSMNEAIVSTMDQLGTKMNQMMAAMRLMNHQIDTLLRLSSNGNYEERQKFFDELRKTIAFADFLDSLMSTKGQFFNDPIRTKLEKLRGWNSLPDVVQCNFDGLQLQRYIQENPQEFTEEEISLLEKEFNFVAHKATLDVIEVGEEINVSPTADAPAGGATENSDVSESAGATA